MAAASLVLASPLVGDQVIDKDQAAVVRELGKGRAYSSRSFSPALNRSKSRTSNCQGPGRHHGQAVHRLLQAAGDISRAGMVWRLNFPIPR